MPWLFTIYLQVWNTILIFVHYNEAQKETRNIPRFPQIQFRHFLKIFHIILARTILARATPLSRGNFPGRRFCADNRAGVGTGNPQGIHRKSAGNTQEIRAGVLAGNSQGSAQEGRRGMRWSLRGIRKEVCIGVTPEFRNDFLNAPFKIVNCNKLNQFRKISGKPLFCPENS